MSGIQDYLSPMLMELVPLCSIDTIPSPPPVIQTFRAYIEDIRLDTPERKMALYQSILDMARRIAFVFGARQDLSMTTFVKKCDDHSARLRVVVTKYDKARVG